MHNIKYTSPKFGMRYEFVKINPEAEKSWFDEDREFFDTTDQNFLINMAAQKLKPKNDTLVMRLGLPETDWAFIEKDKKAYYNYSYPMFVDIVRNVKGKSQVIKTYDLSEKDIPLEIGNYQDKLQVNECGPYAKMMKFIESLKEKTD